MQHDGLAVQRQIEIPAIDRIVCQGVCPILQRRTGQHIPGNAEGLLDDRLDFLQGARRIVQGLFQAVKQVVHEVQRIPDRAVHDRDHGVVERRAVERRGQHLEPIDDGLQDVVEAQVAEVKQIAEVGQDDDHPAEIDHGLDLLRRLLALGHGLDVRPVRDVRDRDRDFHQLQDVIVEPGDRGVHIQALQTGLGTALEVERQRTEERAVDQVIKGERLVVFRLQVVVLVESHRRLGEKVHAATGARAAGGQTDKAQPREELKVVDIQRGPPGDMRILDQDRKALRPGRTVEIDDPFKPGLDGGPHINRGRGPDLQDVAQVEPEIEGEVLQVEQVDFVALDMLLGEEAQINQVVEVEARHGQVRRAQGIVQIQEIEPIDQTGPNQLGQPHGHARIFTEQVAE